jgi:2,4-didehydro-3-deoxy-L-rhamnonate hydrolase
MRIGRASGRLVIIDRDGVIDVATASDGEFSADPDRVFPVWDRFTEWAGGHAGPGARTGPLVPGELGAPVLAPAQVFGIGLNYREHAAESGVDAPAERVPEFLRPGTTLVSTIEGLGELRNALVAGPGFPRPGR